MGAATSAQLRAPVELIRKFATLLALTPDELPLFNEICGLAKPVKRRQDIVLEGKRTARSSFCWTGC